MALRLALKQTACLCEVFFEIWKSLNGKATNNFLILLVFITYIFTDPWPQNSQGWWGIGCRERDKADHLYYWGASYACRIPEAEICICVRDVRPSAACIKVTVVKASYRGRMKKGMRLTGATNTPSARLVGLLTLPQDDICLKCWGVHATLHLFVKAACFELCKLFVFNFLWESQPDVPKVWLTARLTEMTMPKSLLFESWHIFCIQSTINSWPERHGWALLTGIFLITDGHSH